MKNSILILITTICVIVMSTVPASADIYPDGMVSCWKFDETSGNTAYDFLGNNDGKVHNELWTTGMFDGALDFRNGTWKKNTVVVVPYNGSLDFTGEVTVEAWLYGKNLGDWDNVLINSSYAYPYWYDNGYGMYYYDGAINFYVGHMEKYFAIAPFSQNEWHHVVGTYDGTTIRVYVDGVEGEPYIYTGDVVNIEFPMLFGGSCGYQYWGGFMDEIAIYDRTLSQEEIEVHYQDSLDGLSYCFSLPDADDDLAADDDDNCVNIYNPGQADADEDGVGDACDICPSFYDPDQTDSDDNGVGDACDAYWLKASSIDMLEEAKKGMNCRTKTMRYRGRTYTRYIGKCTVRDINRVIRAIDRSLTPAYWIDENSLNPEPGRDSGIKVFQYERRAVSYCIKGPDRVVDPVCYDVTDNLVAADYLLAQTAIDEASAAVDTNPDNRSCAEKDLKNAEKHMDKAEQLLDKTHYASAISQYRNAWSKAQNSLDYSSGEKKCETERSRKWNRWSRPWYRSWSR